MRIRCRENVFTEPLPRNGPGISAHLVVVAYQRPYKLYCSLLKAVRPEWPTGILAFLFRGLCLRRLCLVSPFSPWLGFHGDYFPTAPAVRSLRPLVPSASHIGCQSVQVYQHHPRLPIGGGNSFESGQCSYIHGSYNMLLVVSSFVSEGLTPPQCQVTHFPNPDRRLDSSLHDLQNESLFEDPAGYPLTS
jgi:hypothetical protein